MKTWRQLLNRSRKGLDAYAASLDVCPDCTGYTASIAGIFISPIKSLGMIELPHAMVTRYGLATDGGIHDRTFMLAKRVFDKRWDFERLTQREIPLLATIAGTLEGQSIVYTATGMEPLVLNPFHLHAKMGRSVSVRLSSDSDIHQLVSEDGPVTQWIRSFLCRNSGIDRQRIERAHVLCRPTSFYRQVEDRHACGNSRAQTLLSDGGQLLVTSVETLDWTNAQIALECEGYAPLCMEVFRPNIVLSQLPANMEDVIKEMRIHGHHTLSFGGLCVRCRVTTVHDGLFRKDNQPLAFLGKHRPARPPENEGATFGVNCVLTGSEWTFRKGDSLSVIAEK